MKMRMSGVKIRAGQSQERTKFLAPQTSVHMELGFQGNLKTVAMVTLGSRRLLTENLVTSSVRRSRSRKTPTKAPRFHGNPTSVRLRQQSKVTTFTWTSGTSRRRGQNFRRRKRTNAAQGAREEEDLGHLRPPQRDGENS